MFLSVTSVRTVQHTNAIVRRPSVERSRSDGRITDLSFRMSVPTGFRQGLFGISDILECMSLRTPTPGRAFWSTDLPAELIFEGSRGAPHQGMVLVHAPFASDILRRMSRLVWVRSGPGTSSQISAIRTGHIVPRFVKTLMGFDETNCLHNPVTYCTQRP